MLIGLPDALSLAAQCAPTVAPETLLSVVQAESGFDPLAIGVNGKPRVTVTAATRAEASAKASALIAAGRSVDLGLAQINSRNLGWLGLTVEAAFDPCRNLAAAARVLQAAYDPRNDAQAQPALLRALSRYNTGDERRGFANGYVQKVTRAAAQVVPALQAQGEIQTLAPAALATVADDPAPRASWDVFGESSGAQGFVLRLADGETRRPGAAQ